MRRIVVLITGILFGGSVFGSVESECAGPASDTEKCLYFLKGYLYGLNEVANRDSEIDISAGAKAESFMERAIRTRLGDAASRAPKSATGLNVCIPLDAGIPTIARQLQAVFANDAPRWVEESDPLLTALEQRFPCD